MPTASTRAIVIQFSGDVTANLQFNAAANSNSPGDSGQPLVLASGDNTINVPNSAGSTPTCATIYPPNGNIIALKFKGVGGDQGVRLHNTDPSSIALDPSVTSFVLNVASQMNGCRIAWS